MTLLKAGAVVNASDTNGMTPLLYAAMDNPNPDVMNLLIDAGANDVTSKSGKSALILAAMMNCPEVVTTLVNAGADVNARDDDGKSALDYAGDNNKLKGTSILRTLEELTREAKK